MAVQYARDVAAVGRPSCIVLWCIINYNIMRISLTNKIVETRQFGWYYCVRSKLHYWRIKFYARFDRTLKKYISFDIYPSIMLDRRVTIFKPPYVLRFPLDYASDRPNPYICYSHTLLYLFVYFIVSYRCYSGNPISRRMSAHAVSGNGSQDVVVVEKYMFYICRCLRTTKDILVCALW